MVERFCLGSTSCNIPVSGQVLASLSHSLEGGLPRDATDRTSFQCLAADDEWRLATHVVCGGDKDMQLAAMGGESAESIKRARHPQEALGWLVNVSSIHSLGDLMNVARDLEESLPATTFLVALGASLGACVLSIMLALTWRRLRRLQAYSALAQARLDAAEMAAVDCQSVSVREARVLHVEKRALPESTLRT